MSPTQIGLLILAIVAAMALIAFAAQNYENKRKEKKLKIMALMNDVRKAQHLATAYPNVFMTMSVKKLLGSYLERKWEIICELENSPTNQQQLSNAQTLKNEAVDPTPHEPGSLTIFPDPVTAQSAKGVVEEFYRFLAEIQKKNEVTSKVCESYQKQLQIAHARSRIDADIFEALQIEQMTSSEAALPKMRNSFNQLEQISSKHKVQGMDRQIYELRTKVDQMNEAKKDSEAKRNKERDDAYEEEKKRNQMGF